MFWLTNQLGFSVEITPQENQQVSSHHPHFSMQVAASGGEVMRMFTYLIVTLSHLRGEVVLGASGKEYSKNVWWISKSCLLPDLPSKNQFELTWRVLLSWIISGCVPGEERGRLCPCHKCYQFPCCVTEGILQQDWPTQRCTCEWKLPFAAWLCNLLSNWKQTICHE